MQFLVFGKQHLPESATSMEVQRLIAEKGEMKFAGEGCGERLCIEGRLITCREGPRGARVDRVEVTIEEPEGVDGFSIV